MRKKLKTLVIVILLNPIGFICITTYLQTHKQCITYAHLTPIFHSGIDHLPGDDQRGDCEEASRPMSSMKLNDVKKVKMQGQCGAVRVFTFKQPT